MLTTKVKGGALALGLMGRFFVWRGVEGAAPYKKHKKRGAWGFPERKGKVIQM